MLALPVVAPPHVGRATHVPLATRVPLDTPPPDTVRAGATGHPDSLRDSVRPAPGDPIAAARAADSAARARPPIPVLPGAILPAHRIVAYYGNPLSRRMGILGAIPPDSMLARLAAVADSFARADSTTPVMRALELVAIVAQASPGPRGLYRARMPDSVIQRVGSWADRRGDLLILDVQPGKSPILDEVRSLLPFLREPRVHLALDPEFAMRRTGGAPGTRIGSLDAEDINAVIDTLTAFVQREGLPPKVLIVHRFTQAMVRHASRIRPTPEVQVVMTMDGFGTQYRKRDSYRRYIAAEPVQFAGIKLFYRNDRPLFTPRDVVALDPEPLFITYQ
ncbi:MAG TPA: hypothetical protein VFK13_04050 [Gemmatimonadaceae bacterium]|nr:hypothetical protein [Gemmatimonadaceae bacterium]